MCYRGVSTDGGDSQRDYPLNYAYLPLVIKASGP